MTQNVRGSELRRIAGRPLVSRTDVERLVRQAVRARLGARAAGPHPLVVSVRARHCHLSEAALEALFGPGHRLRVLEPLSQGGEFVAEETVAIIGPRQRVISGLRIVGPCRADTQVELAGSDGLALGFELPLRRSGDLDGTPGATLVGPGGAHDLRRGVIRPMRHVHMSPADAGSYGVRPGDFMRVRIGGPAGATLERVAVRVDPSWRLEVHLDTDEANACTLQADTECELLR